MSRRRKLTRRQFIRLSALAGAGAVMAACGPATEVAAPTEEPEEPAEEPEEPTEEPEEPEEPAEPASKYNEAPMLAALVESGELPPVDDRLPVNPYICEVHEMVGNYGGTIRRGFKGVSDRWGPTKHIDRCLVWYDIDLVLQPRLIESWDISDDAKTITLYLRKGTKWSDGTELTSADFEWFYENQAKNEELSLSPPGSHSTRDEEGNKVLCDMEFPDDYTVVFKFAHPNPMFFYGCARSINGYLTPGHHMEQFHADFADEAELQAKIDEAGFGSWTELFEDRNWWYLNRERPMFSPWLAKNSLAEELFLMERNPYYFGVDPEGNQLPYLDTVSHRLFESPEVFNLWIVNGEIDFQARHVQLDNFTLYKENEESADYKVFIGNSAGHQALQLNLATQNDQLREFFNNRDVRIGISYAMNREEVNELVYNGLLTPRQYSPLPMSPNYYPKLSEAHIAYDPDLANEYLDNSGYLDNDGDGIREFPDGTPISFIIEGTAEAGTAGEDAVQLVTQYLADVGIQATYKYFERSLYTEHFQANEIEAAWWGGDRTVVPLAPGAPIFRGTMIDRPWAAGYGIWFNSNGTDPNGVEPPEGHFIWDIWEIWSQIEVEPDPDRQNELFEQILDIWAKELPMIGLLGESPALIIVKNGFRNYLEGMPIDDTTGDEHLLQTETYFWEDPEAHS
ncbi:MAG: ABC transporter substrate-binding protein [Anaerolineae bacterium]